HAIRQWDLATGKPVRLIRGVRGSDAPGEPLGHTNSVSGLALSPAGRWLYSSGWDHRICVWEAERGSLARVLQGPGRRAGSSVQAIALSPDGTRLAAVLYQEKEWSLVHIWDLLTGRKVAALPGHRAFVTALAFSPDGRRLASGSADTTALVWDVTR